MELNDLRKALRELRAGRAGMRRRQRVEAAKLLLDAPTELVMQLRTEVHENDAATNRRNAKRRETEVDPKPPIKPVSVAKPTKPKKPTYNGL